MDRKEYKNQMINAVAKSTSREELMTWTESINVQYIKSLEAIQKRFEAVAEVLCAQDKDCLSVCDSCEAEYPMAWILDNVCPFCGGEHQDMSEHTPHSEALILGMPYKIATQQFLSAVYNNYVLPWMHRNHIRNMYSTNGGTRYIASDGYNITDWEKIRALTDDITTLLVVIVNDTPFENMDEETLLSWVINCRGNE